MCAARLRRVTPKPWCPDHGTAVGRMTEDHIGVYCTQCAACHRSAPARV
ncbi:hypothetical protein ACFY15_27630 [Streptomyces sp. NPDC001373]